MLFADGALGIVLLGLWIFCFIDVVITDESDVRNLPKLAWLFIVLLFPDIGSIAWLVAGRPWDRSASHTSRGAGRAYPEYDRPGRAVAGNPEDDEEFLAKVRERAETQRRQYEARRRAELQAERDRLLKRPEDQ